MIVGKTQRAIAEVLLLRDTAMNADEIFLLLNKEAKQYSYAAVYHNLKQLTTKGILVDYHAGRKKSFVLHDDWKANK